MVVAEASDAWRVSPLGIVHLKNWFVDQAMKPTAGKANPQTANELLTKKSEFD
jgi:Asp-tRNA(Asn)/Glu-tRNA(Gln) amidotransferase B subunit